MWAAVFLPASCGFVFFYVHTLSETRSRRQLLLQYNAQLSYIITAPNTDPKAIIATLAVPGTSALLGSTAASLTGIQATVGTITFLDLSPTPGPTMLPTPFSIFAQVPPFVHFREQCCMSHGDLTSTRAMPLLPPVLLHRRAVWRRQASA
jgi:hypothetical protein